jgi:hypothetical protein
VQRLVGFDRLELDGVGLARLDGDLAGRKRDAEHSPRRVAGIVPVADGDLLPADDRSVGTAAPHAHGDALPSQRRSSNVA